MRRLASLSVVVALVAACSSGGDHEAVGTQAAKVINGVVDLPAKYDATISMYMQVSSTEAAGCTGTLISPHVVITARHCVSSYNDDTRSFGADYKTANILIWYGAEPRGNPDNTVNRIVHPGGSQIEDNDFAMLVLTKAATAPFAPIRLSKAPVRGEEVAVAGYGLTTSDTGPTAELHKRYRREGLAILALGPAPTYGIGAGELALGESICQGDSGGPVYAQETGALLAVTSRGGNGTSPTATQPWLGCTGSRAFNLFARVDKYAALIRDVTASVSEKPWEEGTAKPVAPVEPVVPVPDPGQLGSACTESSQCESKFCVSVDGKAVCASKCSAEITCPTGFVCESEFCIAAPPVVEQPTQPAADQPVAKTSSCSVGPRGSDARSALVLPALSALALLVARRRRR